MAADLVKMIGEGKGTTSFKTVAGASIQAMLVDGKGRPQGREGPDRNRDDRRRQPVERRHPRHRQRPAAELKRQARRELRGAPAASALSCARGRKTTACGGENRIRDGERISPPFPPTTRHAGPHRAVRGVEVTRQAGGLPAWRRASWARRREWPWPSFSTSCGRWMRPGPHEATTGRAPAVPGTADRPLPTASAGRGRPGGGDESIRRGPRRRAASRRGGSTPSTRRGRTAGLRTSESGFGQACAA